jgi:hypothetical protein
MHGLYSHKKKGKEKQTNTEYYNEIHGAGNFIKKADLFNSQFWRFKGMTLALTGLW